MKISRLLFWILFPLCFIIMSLLLVFYLDIANGPNACFVIMILLLIGLFTTQIVIRNSKMKFRLLSWAVFILLATILVGSSSLILNLPSTITIFS